MAENVEESFDEVFDEDAESEGSIDLASPDADSGGLEERFPSSPQFLDVAEPDPDRFDTSTAILADGMNIETVMGSLSKLSGEIDWPLRAILELHGDYDFEAIHGYAEQEDFDIWTVTDDIDIEYVDQDLDRHYPVRLMGSTGSKVQTSSITGFTSELDDIRNDIVVNDIANFFERLYQEADDGKKVPGEITAVARNYAANLVEDNTDFQELLSVEYDREVEGTDELDGIGHSLLQDVSDFLAGPPEEGTEPREKDLLGKVITQNEIANYSNLFNQKEVPYNLVVMYSMDLNESPEDIDHHLAAASRRFAEIDGYTVALGSTNLSENYVNSASDTLRI